MDNKKLWYKFERIAIDFLEDKWFKIINKNFTIRGGEIDIIAIKDNIVSFVEVKGSSKSMDFHNYITKKKIEALKRTAETRIHKNDNDNIWEYKFDLILINSYKVVEFIENFTL